MTLQLPEEIRAALGAKPGEPVFIEDAQTQLQYVLLPIEVYRRAKSVFAVDDLAVTETYAEQSRVAGEAGWDDPEMDAYDNYDAHRQST